MTFCILCECEFEGFGNNPEPLADGSKGDVCCDDCNKKVIAARLSEVIKKNSTLPNRKPDFEDNKVRGWYTSKEEEKFLKKEKGITIFLPNGEEFTLIGFNEIRLKENNKLVFAYKNKNNEAILYFIPYNLTETEYQEAEKLLIMFKSRYLGWNFINLKDNIKSIQKHTKKEEENE
jgi:hypothetical protein